MIEILPSASNKETARNTRLLLSLAYILVLACQDSEFSIAQSPEKLACQPVMEGSFAFKADGMVLTLLE